MLAMASRLGGLIAAGCVLAAFAGIAADAADPYGYRLTDRNRNVFGGKTGVDLYAPQPYRSPLYQPRRQDYAPNWKPAPGLNPLLKPRRDLRPWQPR